MIPLLLPGFCSEYTVAPEQQLLLNPPNLSFEEAAGCPGTVVTALQCAERGLELMGQRGGTLEGKTVFVTAGLGASGPVACQMLKNVYGAEKVITTVSTPKVPLVEQYLPGVVDKVVDYKTQNVVKEVGKGEVDFVFNTVFDVTATFPLANPKTGVVISILSIPPSSTIKKMLGPENVPFWLSWGLDLFQFWYKWKLKGTNIKMEFVSGNPADREDLEKAGELVARGKVKPIITVVPLSDLNRVRQECGKIAARKGGVGKLVIKIV